MHTGAVLAPPVWGEWGQESLKGESPEKFIGMYKYAVFDIN